VDPPSGAAWTAGQVASNLGISESTLRTWHRRYGLSPRDSRPGRYRRYLAADVARLRRMRDLVAGGMLASEAARVVQGASVQGRRAGTPPSRDVTALAAAAGALDTTRCGALLDSLFARRGVVDAWELVCCPALRAVNAHPGDDPAQIAVEHALSWALSGALHRLPRPPGPAAGAELILLACTAGEQHTLPLAALAAALAEDGVASRALGAATPADTLERAVREVQPGVVVLWSQRAHTADQEALLAVSRSPARCLAAGPGWDPGALGGAQPVTTLREAVAALAGEPD
jgi:DNA-binding transcriptional MerR regulator